MTAPEPKLPTTKRRAWQSGVVTLAMALATLFCPVQAAGASGTGIEISTDGVNFSTGSSVSLFDDIALNVPGDTQTQLFWVRNSADSAGYLRVMVADVVSSDPMLADALVVRAHTDSVAGDPVQLSKASPCWVLVEGDRVGAGATVKVTAALALGNLTNADGQSGNTSFSLRVHLTDAAVGSLPPTSCGGATTHPNPDSGPPAVIAMTGSDVPYPLLVTGAGALGVGLFLLIAARRRRQEDE